MHPSISAARPLSPIVALALTLALAAAAGGQSTAGWTQWGGPSHDFVAPAAGLADSWGEHGPRRLWSRPLGEGYSTILVEDGRLYTMYRAGDLEVVIAMDAATGETVWEHRYDHDPSPDHVTGFGSGPRATPLLSGDRIFTIGVAGLMHCLLKADGEVVWSHNLWGAVFGGNQLPHGYASSPIAYRDTVIALVGGEGKSIVAFRQADGQVVWQGLSHLNSYSTPQILEVDGEEQLVAFMAEDLVGVDPATGEELWRYPLENQYGQNINPPLLVDGRYLFLSSREAGARGLELRRRDGKTEVEELWAERKIQFYHVTSVNDGDWAYGSSGSRSPAFMSAVNVKTGEIGWRQRGIAKANSLYADGRVIVLDEDGTLYLTTATPEELTIHSRVEILDRVAWSVPTVVGSTLYVRDTARIMALDLSAAATAAEAAAAAEVVAAVDETAVESSEPAEAGEAAAAEPAEDSEAVAILRRADAAAQAVRGVRFKAISRSGGATRSRASDAEGSGVIFGWSGRRPERFRVRGKTTRPATGEPIEVTRGTDGETFFLVDHLTRKGYEDIDPAVMGSAGDPLENLWMVEFVHPEPFDEEIRAESAELRGTEEVGGVLCYEIHVVYSGGRGVSTWYISTGDYLPRRRVSYFNFPEGEGTLELILTDFEVDPEIGPETFAMELPEGYERVDDFAP